MKKANGVFTLSATDKKKIAAHCRAVARKAAYTGYVEAWLDNTEGKIHYVELIGLDFVEASNMELIYSARTNK